MKKYKKPAMRMVEMEQKQMICASPGDPSGPDGGGSRETNGFWSSEE